MGNVNSNLNGEKMSVIFLNKYNNYRELMKYADCSEEEINSKNGLLMQFDMLSDEDKARVVKDDLSFLNYFTNGGLVFTNENGIKLFDGINKEVAHSVICTMSSIKSTVELPKEFEDELNEPLSLPKIKDMVSFDMSEVFPDIKKMFFLGKSELFYKKMMYVFDDQIERFSGAVDVSVNHNSEAYINEYMDLINHAKAMPKEYEFDEKSKKLS